MIAISLPVSRFALSVSQFILLGNWLLEFNFSEKFERIKKKKSLLIFLSIFLIHLIGLIYTKDIQTGFFDIKIKAPLLLLPLIIVSSNSLDFKQIKIIFLFFAASTFVATLISSTLLFGFTNHEIIQNTEISIFINHISFSVLINISVFFLLYLIFYKWDSLIKAEKFIYPIIIIWLSVFLFFLQSMTGIFILFVAGFVFIFNIIYRLNNIKIKYLLFIVLFSFPVLSSVLTIKTVVNFYSYKEAIDKNTIDKYTKHGNPYTHLLDSKTTENGYFLYLYICKKELREEWNKISKIDFDGFDKNGQKMQHTLVRYLTSKGLRKDYEGINKLDSIDISFIEKGYANCICRKKYSISPLIYKIVWQIDIYLKGSKPEGHSILQRIKSIEIAFDIIKENFLFGVGSGDMNYEFKEYYKKHNMKFVEHLSTVGANQFISFFVKFGFLGFLWIIYAFVSPVFIENKQNNYFLFLFLFIILLAMFSEEILKFQTGVTYFSFFYSLFLFTNNKK